VRNPVYVPPTTKSEAARSHGVVVATLSTYRVLPTPKQSTDSDFYAQEREGTFIVLFTIKGNAKAGDLILVRDSPNSCDAGFHAQFTQVGADQKLLMATSNTWLLFLSGEVPYKLWESPRSGPLNLFTTDEIRELFVSNAGSKER
jgi:hypothetical protein